MSKPIATLDLSLGDDPFALKAWIKTQARALGFNDCVVAKPDAQAQLAHFQRYLDLGYHADMDYLTQNLDKRGNPALLVPGTQSILCVRMDYLQDQPEPRHIPNCPDLGIIARYARGRDYHKVMRGRLKQLAQRIEAHIGPFSSRPFSDSAPIFEKSLAESAGMGWTGKHSLLIQRQAGSFFVLGELFCNLALPFDEASSAHCGSCSACIDICPTQAIVEPYLLDARKCIAYLTIEYQGSIPLELRAAMGNRIFGCDDCQLICPWNRYAKTTTLADFQTRHQLDRTTLLEFWDWDQATFLAKTEGSALRRTGYQSFKRNVAVAMGNAPFSRQLMQALTTPHCEHQALVDEHGQWAIQQQLQKSALGCS
jgi:epoxyqueuosine reductase